MKYLLSSMILLTVAYFAIGYTSLTQTTLSSDELSNLTGATITCNSALHTQLCGDQPPGYDLSGEQCSTGTGTVGASITKGGVTITIGVTGTYCYGGCGSKCLSDDNEKFCVPSTNSTCNSADEDPCIGEKFVSANTCALSSPMTGGCSNCQYASSGGC